MGCWDETCALSGVGIRHGDPVVRVEAKYSDRKLDWYIMFGMYRDRYDFKRVRSIMSGEYDDYGGLENHPRGDVEPNIATYFFHNDVWKWALEEHDRVAQVWWRPVSEILIDPMSESMKKFGLPADDITLPQIDEFVKVVRVAEVLRRPLGIPQHGPQIRNDSFASQTGMAQLVLEKIAAIEEKEKEWEND